MENFRSVSIRNRLEPTTVTETQEGPLTRKGYFSHRNQKILFHGVNLDCLIFM